MGTLDGKVALISGAGRGIGKAIAQRLADEGAQLVLNDLDADVLNDTIAELTAGNATAVACRGSVTDLEFPERFVNTAIDAFGTIDIVVNNAGYNWDNVIQHTTDEQWEAMLDIHVGTPFRMLRALQPVFKQLYQIDMNSGRHVHRKVVNISSLSGTQGNAGQAAYSAGKAGVIGLTKATAKEFSRFRVNVNAVAFGVIDTRLTTASASDGSQIRIGDRAINVGLSDKIRASLPTMIPLGRSGTANEAAGAVYLLCSPDSDYITGETLQCSGGL